MSLIGSMTAPGEPDMQKEQRADLLAETQVKRKRAAELFKLCDEAFRDSIEAMRKHDSAAYVEASGRFHRYRYQHHDMLLDLIRQCGGEV